MSETTILWFALGFVSVLWIGTFGLLILYWRKYNKVMFRYMRLKLNHETLRTNHSSLIGMYASLEKECRAVNKNVHWLEAVQADKAGRAREGEIDIGGNLIDPEIF